MDFSSRKLLPLVLVAFAESQAWAQAGGDAPADLKALLAPGMTVWITDSSGQEQRTRIVDVSEGVVTTAVAKAVRSFRTVDIVRIRARRADSVIDGALIGAGAAVASGLVFCTLMELWENCRDDVGPMLKIGALGAGIGIGVDALIRGRKIIYEAPPHQVTLRAVPIVEPGVKGLVISLTFE